jgi:3-keto-L-gulonate-6-phosphate decarboxylase
MGRAAAELSALPGLTVESACTLRNVCVQAIIAGRGVTSVVSPTNAARLELMTQIFNILRG